MQDINRKQAPLIKVIIAFAIVYLVWGSTYFFVQAAERDFLPFILGAFRFIASGGLLMAWCSVKGYKLINRPQLKTSFIVGNLLLFIGNGSIIWAETIKAIRKLNPGTTMETLIPDFQGNWENLQRVINERPEIISHNIETVRRLTKQVRIQAKYDRSLEVLKRIKESGIRTKSGIMLGLGELKDEVLESLEDLLTSGVDVLTLGQYLQPTREHLKVYEYISPEIFAEYKRIGIAMGFKYVESGPLVRSSYHAEKHLL